MTDTPSNDRPWENRRVIPFVDHLGIEIDQWQDGEVVIVAEVLDEHCNFSGLPHGGFISTMLDCATALAGVYTDDPVNVRKALTLSLNINFIGQAQTRKLKAIGKMTAGGSRIFYSQAHVEDLNGNLVATAQGVFRYRSGSEAV